MYDTPEESATGQVRDVHCGPQLEDQVTPSSAVASAIRFRYELMPLLYSLHIDASINGVPIVRPYCYCFQDDDQSNACWTEGESFMLGSSLLVANVLRPNKETGNVHTVYLPRTSVLEKENGWYDFWTGQCYSGGQHLKYRLHGLSHIPLFLRAGGIVPLIMSPNPLNIRSSRDRAEALRFLVTTLQPCKRFTLYKEEDRAITFSTSISDDLVELQACHVRSDDYKEYVFEFFVESVPSSFNFQYEGRASGKGAKSVYLASSSSSLSKEENMSKLPMFLNRSELNGSKIGGWFFDMSGARVVVRIPSSEIKFNDTDDDHECNFVVRVSFNMFDLIGM